MTEPKICTCPSGDGSLRHPCPAHPAPVELAGVAANLTFINGRPAMCGCQVEYSSGGGEYSDVIYVTLCAKHSGSAILDLVATNRIALTPEYEGQWHADLYLDREVPLAKAEGATPAEAVLALMSAERIDPEQESAEQAGWDEGAAFFKHLIGRHPAHETEIVRVVEHNYAAWKAWQARAALAQPSPVPELELPASCGPMPEINYANYGEDEVKALQDWAFAATDELTAFDRIMEKQQKHIEWLAASLAKWIDRAENWSAVNEAALARVAELEKQKEFGRVIVSMKGGYKCFEFDEYSHAHSFPEGEHQLYTAPVAQAQHSVPDDVETFLGEVRAELLRARSKFPGDRIMTIALAEEFGELCKAVLDEPAANVRKEAVQTAVMAARVVLDGDGSVTAWRAERGLDPLAAAPGKEGV